MNLLNLILDEDNNNYHGPAKTGGEIVTHLKDLAELLNILLKSNNSLDHQFTCANCVIVNLRKIYIGKFLDSIDFAKFHANNYTTAIPAKFVDINKLANYLLIGEESMFTAIPAQDGGIFVVIGSGIRNFLNQEVDGQSNLN